MLFFSKSSNFEDFWRTLVLILAHFFFFLIIFPVTIFLVLSPIFRELTSERFPRGAEEDASEELEHFCGGNVVDDERIAGRLRREAVVLEEGRQLCQPAGVHEAETLEFYL